RAEIGFALARDLERRRRGEIFLGIGQYRAQARSLHLDDAVLVERDGFGYRRRDQQEFFQLETKIGREALGRDVAAFGRALEHVVNFLDEVLDLGSGAGGDLFLQPGQLIAAFVIAKIKLEQSARDQSAADQQHGDQKIIAHQPAAVRRARFAPKQRPANSVAPAAHATRQSPYHLVGSGEDVGGNRQADLSGGFQVDKKVESGRLLHGNLRWFASLEEFVDKRGDAGEAFVLIRAVGHQAAFAGEFAAHKNRWQALASCQASDQFQIRCAQRARQYRNRRATRFDG